MQSWAQYLRVGQGLEGVSLSIFYIHPVLPELYLEPKS